MKLIATVGDGPLYSSADSGVTWTARDSARGWVGVASSADGNRLLASVYNGLLYVSLDSGLTWVARATTRGWSGVAVTADGQQMLAGDNGGRLYVSFGVPTVVAEAAGTAAGFHYLGNGVWQPAKEAAAAGGSTGPVADTNLSANVALLNGTNVFSGTNRFTGKLTSTNAANVFAGTFTGNGAGLTGLAVPAASVIGTLTNAQIPNLDGSKLTTGTVADARLSANVALLNGTNVFNGTNRVTGPLTATNAANVFAGTFTGNGAGLTNLPIMTGPQGIPGTNGPRGLTFRGAWLSTSNYLVDDAVFSGGSAWLAKRATNNAPPLEGAFWTLLAQQGATGATGPAGTNGARGLTFRGAWLSTSNYVVNDAVFSGGSAWLAKQATNNAPPLEGAFWTLLAQQGATGAAGATGPAGAIGPQGIQGLAGSNGLAGVAGPTGPAGTNGLQGPRGLTFRGAWLSTSNYVVNDAVFSGGSAWLAKQATNNAPPLEGAFWTLLAQQGATGPGGAIGLQGIQGLPGSNGVAGVAGPSGPAGSNGLQGPRGLTFRGAWQSTSNYVVDDAVFSGGSAWIAKQATNNALPIQGAFWTLLAQQGATGATGPQGSNGLAGVAGPSGPAGTNGASGPRGLTFRGAWLSTSNYVVDDAVFSGGSAWLAKRATNNAPPLEGAFWTLLAQQGATGAAGATGPIGPIGPTGATGPQGPAGPADASAVLVGTLADARLSANVALRTGTNLFTGTNTFSGALTATNANNLFSGAFTGNGSGLTNLAISVANVAGTFTAAQIPNLDAAKLTSGLLVDARLSAAIARQTDVTTAVNTTSNGLSTRLLGTNDAVVALINSLTAQLASLTANLTAVSNLALFSGGGGGGGGGSPSSASFVSADPLDPTLLALGLRSVVTAPAPAWATSSSGGIPTARSGHSAVWTGQEMILWGGRLGAGLYSATGASYRPALDAWQAVSTVGAPTARGGHSAVWTGAEMIVWGGFSGVFYTGDGGRFALSNQLWSAVSLVGAPPPRDGHIGLWTGARLLIWGGRNMLGPVASGALYDPTNNTWTALALPNPPAPRAQTAAVWAGDRLLLWGGDGTNGWLNTGAQLLFTNGVPAQWRTVTTTGAPSARSGHTAVWTGGRFIVWGGAGAGGFVGDGASYDPVADTWSPLPAVNAPTPRTLATATWTGVEMVVYGGETISGTSATGAAYDPAAGKWRALTNPGASTARSEATAAWTGAELLFFGGRSAGAPLAALQRLTPQPTWYFFRKP